MGKNKYIVCADQNKDLRTIKLYHSGGNSTGLQCCVRLPVSWAIALGVTKTNGVNVELFFNENCITIKKSKVQKTCAPL